MFLREIATQVRGGETRDPMDVVIKMVLGVAKYARNTGYPDLSAELKLLAKSPRTARDFQELWNSYSWLNPLDRSATVHQVQMRGILKIAWNILMGKTDADYGIISALEYDIDVGLGESDILNPVPHRSGNATKTAKSMKDFINQWRGQIVAYIREQLQDNTAVLNDAEIKLFILNDSSLKTWARRDGVVINQTIGRKNSSEDGTWEDVKHWGTITEDLNSEIKHLIEELSRNYPQVKEKDINALRELSVNLMNNTLDDSIEQLYAIMTRVTRAIPNEPGSSGRKLISQRFQFIIRIFEDYMEEKSLMEETQIKESNMLKDTLRKIAKQIRSSDTELLNEYLDTALWASTDDDGQPLDRNYGIRHFSKEAIASSEKDLSSFMEEAAPFLEGVDNIGHDFWLTRNGHGAGFWDRGYGEAGKKLTDIAHSYGEVNLYVGDDDLIYIG
jgi:hypothetical protein